VYCTLARTGYDARYQGIVTIEYSLHPLYGRQFDVVRRFRRVGLITFEILLDETRTRVPEWMTRREVCAQLRCGVDPVCCLSALRQVQELLDQHDL
jgi:hypothetical protein